MGLKGSDFVLKLNLFSVKLLNFVRKHFFFHFHLLYNILHALTINLLDFLNDFAQVLDFFLLFLKQVVFFLYDFLLSLHLFISFLGLLFGALELFLEEGQLWVVVFLGLLGRGGDAVQPDVKFVDFSFEGGYLELLFGKFVLLLLESWLFLF